MLAGQSASAAASSSASDTGITLTDPDSATDTPVSEEFIPTERATDPFASGPSDSGARCVPVSMSYMKYQQACLP